MTWNRNYVPQSTQAKHYEDCAYHFHGGFNPDHDGDRIDYADVFTFAVKGDGHGTLTVYGSIVTTGSK